MNPASIARRRSGKLAQQRGAYTEQCVLQEILREGWAIRAEILATPKKVVRGRVIYTRKVLADIVGWTAGGRIILCECKCNEEDGRFRRPRPSDFEDHQIANLRQVDACGGVALVGYLYTTPDRGTVTMVEPSRNFFP